MHNYDCWLRMMMDMGLTYISSSWYGSRHPEACGHVVPSLSSLASPLCLSTPLLLIVKGPRIQNLDGWDRTPTSPQDSPLIGFCKGSFPGEASTWPRSWMWMFHGGCYQAVQSQTFWASWYSQRFFRYICYNGHTEESMVQLETDGHPVPEVSYSNQVRTSLHSVFSLKECSLILS